MARGRLALALLLLPAMVGCDHDAAPTAPAFAGPVRLVPAADGDVPALTTAAAAEAARDHRRLLVYVGATWCEPCQAFHAAAERGELDAALPGLSLLEFDLDRDEARLAAAGYPLDWVPLFAVAGPDGRATDRFTAGAQKGGDYVAQLVPRLRALLAAP